MSFLQFVVDFYALVSDVISPFNFKPEKRKEVTLVLPNRSVDCELLKLVLLTPLDGIRCLKEHAGLLKKAKGNNLSRTRLRKSLIKTAGGKKSVFKSRRIGVQFQNKTIACFGNTAKYL